MLDGNRPFALDDPEPQTAVTSVARLREVLAVAANR